MSSTVTLEDIEAHFEGCLEDSPLSHETRANARALLLWAYESRCHYLREVVERQSSLFAKEFPLMSTAVARGLRRFRFSAFDQLHTSWSRRRREAAEEYLTCLIQYEEVLPLLTLWRTGLADAKCSTSIVRLEIPTQVRQWLHHGWHALAKRQLHNIAQHSGIGALMKQMRTEAARTARLDNSLLRWDLRPSAFEQLYRAVYDWNKVDHLLPERWVFPRYTLRDFRAFHAYLWTLADLHCFVAHYILGKRRKDLGPSQFLIFKTPSRWVREATEITGLPHDVAQALVEDFSRDPWEIGKTIFFQPLWGAAGWLMLSPHLLLSTNGEVHFNRVAALLYPSAYSKATRIKEDVMVHELKAAFGRLPDVETRQIKFPAQLQLPDVDLLAVDDRQGVALCLQLKWLLPSLSRLDAIRGSELGKGLRQSQAIKNAIDKNPEILARALGKSTLQIARIGHALVSKNDIGSPDNLAESIPILNMEALQELIKSATSLPHLIDLLETRAFLAGIAPPKLVGQRFQCGTYRLCCASG